jgi:hypothetical protein
VSEGHIFVFPQDTIIKPGQKISFSSSTTNLHPINIYDVSLIVGKDISKKSNLVQMSEVANIYSKAQKIKNQIQTLVANTQSVQSKPENNLAAVSVALSTEQSTSTTSTETTHPSWFDKVRQFFFGQ